MRRRRHTGALLALLMIASTLSLGIPEAAADVATITPVADSRVLQSSPTANSGTVARLDVDSPGEQSYIRFNVTGVSGAVQSATLRLFVRNSSSNAPSLYFTSNTWTETGITWNNKPAAIGPAIADVGSASSGTWSEYDLTGDITGNGTYDFVLLPDGSDGIQYDSREGASPPQLVVTSGGGGGEPPTNAPPIAGDDTATTTAGTPVTINVAANDVDPDGNLDPTSATTTCVKTIPSPVIVTQPMTMPAQAQAMATASVFRAPSSSASRTDRHEMPARVALRSSASGRQDRAPTSAHSGAE